jgi:hypothetical protein
MDAKEVRMRCIEAVAATGVREPSRLVRDAAVLEEWVLSAEDKADGPRRGRPTKEADKA